MFRTTTPGAPWRRRRSPRLVLAAALTALVCVLVAGNAQAGTHQGGFVAGTYAAASFGDTDCVPLDDVRLRCATTGFVSSYPGEGGEGDLRGTATADFTQVIDCATGRTRGHGVETFTGTLRGGDPGTLTWRLSFTADFDCELFYPSSFRALAVVTRGSGGLAWLRGALYFDDTSYRGILI